MDTIEQCAEACSGDYSCVAFDFDNGACYLNTQCDKQDEGDGYISCKKTGTVVSLESCDVSGANTNDDIMIETDTEVFKLEGFDRDDIVDIKFSTKPHWVRLSTTGDNGVCFQAVKENGRTRGHAFWLDYPCESSGYGDAHCAGSSESICFPRDSDECIKEEWGSYNYCDSYNKLSYRCCPETCNNGEELLEEDCNELTGHGSCTYPNDAQCSYYATEAHVKHEAQVGKTEAEFAVGDQKELTEYFDYILQTFACVGAVSIVYFIGKKICKQDPDYTAVDLELTWF